MKVYNAKVLLLITIAIVLVSSLVTANPIYEKDSGVYIQSGAGNCTPTWQCLSRSTCSVGNVKYCMTIQDQGDCGVIFNESWNNYNQDCIYVDPSAGYTVTATNVTDLNNVTDVVVESQDAVVDFGGQELNITNFTTSVIVVSKKSVYINTAEVPGFDKPATITISGLTLGSYTIFKDNGQVCNPPTCVVQSYNANSGILVFNVTGFSGYYVYSYTKGDLQNIVSDGIGTAGAEFVFWIEIIVLVLLISGGAYWAAKYWPW